MQSRDYLHENIKVEIAKILLEAKKYPDAKQRYRFEVVPTEMWSE